MDFENHHFSYFFKKRKNTYTSRKVKLSISYKDFHCFELMGFSCVRVSSIFFQQTQKKHTREKTYVSEKPVKTNKISTFPPPKIITTKCHVFSFIKQNKKEKKHKNT